MPKYDREPVAWITRGGKHIPIFEGDEEILSKEEYEKLFTEYERLQKRANEYSREVADAEGYKNSAEYHEDNKTELYKDYKKFYSHRNKMIRILKLKGTAYNKYAPGSLKQLYPEDVLKRNFDKLRSNYNYYLKISGKK